MFEQAFKNIDAGFLCESFDYLKAPRDGGRLTTADFQTLQTRTFYGIGKKSLAYVIAIMNMILHGIETPNIVHSNTLSLNLADIQDKDRMDLKKSLLHQAFSGRL